MHNNNYGNQQIQNNNHLTIAIVWNELQKKGVDYNITVIMVKVNLVRLHK